MVRGAQNLGLGHASARWQLHCEDAARQALPHAIIATDTKCCVEHRKIRISENLFLLKASAKRGQKNIETKHDICRLEASKL